MTRAKGAVELVAVGVVLRVGTAVGCLTSKFAAAVLPLVRMPSMSAQLGLEDAWNEPFRLDLEESKPSPGSLR